MTSLSSERHLNTHQSATEAHGINVIGDGDGRFPTKNTVADNAMTIDILSIEQRYLSHSYSTSEIQEFCFFMRTENVTKYLK